MIDIIILKLWIVVHPEFVIQISARKVQIEVGLVKIKNTIAIGVIDFKDRVVNTVSTVTKCRI
jgi:hypothetical protein